MSDVQRHEPEREFAVYVHRLPGIGMPRWRRALRITACGVGWYLLQKGLDGLMPSSTVLSLCQIWLAIALLILAYADALRRIAVNGVLAGALVLSLGAVLIAALAMKGESDAMQVPAPRRLSKSQKEAIGRLVGNNKNIEMSIQRCRGEECAKFADDFADAIEAAGRERPHIGSSGPDSLPSDGSILIRGCDNTRREVMDALRSIGIPSDSESDCYNGQPGFARLCIGANPR